MLQFLNELFLEARRSYPEIPILPMWRTISFTVNCKFGEGEFVRARQLAMCDDKREEDFLIENDPFRFVDCYERTYHTL